MIGDKYCKECLDPRKSMSGTISKWISNFKTSLTKTTKCPICASKSTLAIPYKCTKCGNLVSKWVLHSWNTSLR